MDERRERDYFCKEEDSEESHNHQNPPFAHLPPPSSSSSSSSSSTRWVPQHQMASTDDRQASGSGGDQQRPLAAAFVEKEHMFEKVVTPSDVGKLNRLVIPKQHAEKYFPLNASANEKGLLLSFEDCTGKQWRFRYSYWNSSQSYVMTKGWSHFVKEKRLDAGDTVSFGRGVGEAGRHRLFIDCKRRPDLLHHIDTHLPGRLPLPPHAFHIHHHHHDCPSSMLSFARSVSPWGGRLAVPATPSAVSSVAIYDDHHRHLNCGYNAAPASNPFWYLRPAGNPSVQLEGGGRGSGGGAGDGGFRVPVVLGSVPVVASNETASKRVRLFGVNLDCSTKEDADSEGGSVFHGHPGRPPALSPLQLSLGISEMMESPRKDKQPMSLDLEM